ncbi:hypothetical protein HY479_03125 [Candidatus Uhrbacteria bacterium]|nr:hypothetical protein [Candidatus Uhrbacteria bacterium]
MIPLPIFLAVWAFLLLIWLAFAAISALQMLRFGVSGHMVYVSTGLFMIVSFLVLSATALFFLTVDWSLGLELSLPAFNATIPL